VNLVFAPQAWEDYLYWQQTDLKMLGRVNQLLRDIVHSPHDGIGKPEPLRGALRGCWSRRIDAEHRLVYRVADGNLLVIQLRYHY
jgi:toxin YoeB